MTKQLKDFLKQDIAVGDDVIFAKSYGDSVRLEKGKITSIGKVKITVTSKALYGDKISVIPEKIYKI